MKLFRISIALFISAALLSGCGEKAPAIESNLKTAAGHSFALWHLPDTKSVSISIDCPDDWLEDPSHNPAVRIIATQLLLAGGAEGIAPAELQEKFKVLQAEGNLLAASADSVRGTLVFPIDNADETVALANRVLTHSSLDQEWLSRIAGETATAIAGAQMQPLNEMLRALAIAAFQDPLLARFAATASPRNITAVTRDEVVAWHKSVFAARGLSVAIAGNIDAERAGKLIDTLLQGLPEREVQKPVLPAITLKNGNILLRGKPDSTTSLAVAYRIHGTGSTADELRLLTGFNMLAGDTNALLFKALREKLQATYGLTYSFEILGDDYLVTFYGEVEATKVVAVRDELTRIVSLMGKQVQQKDMVDSWTGRLAQQNTTNLKDAFFASSTLLNVMTHRRDVQDANRIPRLLTGVTPEDVRRTFAASFPDKAEFLTVVASPDVTVLPGACIIDNAEQAKNCP